MHGSYKVLFSFSIQTSAFNAKIPYRQHIVYHIFLFCNDIANLLKKNCKEVTHDEYGFK